MIPNGLYKLGEAEEGEPALEIEKIEVDPDDETYKAPETEDQIDLSNWLHFPKSILLNNRTLHSEPTLEEGDEREPAEVLKEIIAKDPYESRLKSITEDSGVDGSDSAWTVKLLGPKTRQTVHGEMGKTSTAHYGVVVLKSLRWPGSITCWKGNQQFQIYVGDGLKNEESSYYPVFPPEIPVDPVDQKEMPEPTPLEAPPAEEALAEGEEAQE